MKFQQLTGPVMAKGVEDTAFYRYNRLVALNEVGSDPAAFGTSVAEFHRQNAERARRWPHGLLTSSTHDTKRSEDVRARIAVLSELPREWRAAVNRWARLNRRHKTRVEGASAPDRNDEYLFYQTLLGAWPWGMETPDEDVRRPHRGVHAEGGARGAGPHQLDQPRRGLRRRAAAVRPRRARHFRPNPFLDDIAAMREMVAHAGAINALAQQLLKLTAPGVPDIYQGTELWDQSLVDPDNRRPVDYSAAHPPLARITAGAAPAAGSPPICWQTKADGRIKLYLTSRALACRAAYPDLFARGDYVPLAAEGAAADHVVAFARRDAENEFIVVVPRLVLRSLCTCYGVASPGGPCPHDYPPWQTVYHYFRQWRLDGTWERLNDELRELARERAGRDAPAACRHPGRPIGQDHGKRGPRGYDGAKKLNGRKRHLLVDTGGLVLKTVVQRG